MKPLNIEDIIDSAITDLSQGKPVQEILAEYPEHSEELSGLLSMVHPAVTLPKNRVPRPMRRRRYVAAIHVPWQIKLQSWVKIAMIPATAIFLLVGLTQFVSAAQRSLPGSALFSFKLAAERTRVAVTTNPTDKANLELAYSQKRLNEAQTVLQEQNSSQDQKVAALNELKDQTQNTFAVVPSVATSNAINNNDDSLLKNLIAVNNQQKDLLKAVPDQGETKTVATTALQVAEDNDKTINTLLAAVNDKTLTDLADTQISITGTISAVDYKNQKITVENNSFIVSSSTDIKSGDSAFKFGDITPKTQVTIVGNKTKDGIVADSISVISLAVVPVKAGEVKGASTAKTNSNSEPAKNAPKNDNTDANVIVPDNTTPPVPDQNKVTGGYILEEPNQQ